MRNSVYRGLYRSLILVVLGLVALPACDNTVNILILQTELQEVLPAGWRYSTEGGTSCEVNPDTFDAKLLLLGNTKDRSLRQIREGDLLEDCALEISESTGEGSECFLSRSSVTVHDSKAQNLGTDCTSDDHCDGSWTCNRADGVCENDISLGVTEVSYVSVGNANDDQVEGRIVALLIDNSGSIKGLDHQGSPGEEPTDQMDERLAAAKALIGALDPEKDRICVWALMGEGSTGVPFVSKGIGGAAQGDGCYRTEKGYGYVEEAIESLYSNETGGTPVWDGIEAAADHLRGLEDFDDYRASIVLFTDGYRVQDGNVDPATADLPTGAEYGPIATFGEAVDAVVPGSGTNIPVFIVHMENQDQLAPSTLLGRDALLAELACVSDGAYHFVKAPGAIKTPFEKLFPHMTNGHYQFTISYQALQADRFPAGEYALTGALSLTLEGKTVGFEFERGYLKAREYDSRVFVTKEEQ